MELPEKLHHYLDEVKNATNFGLTYWKVILGIINQFVKKGVITLEQIGTTAAEVSRIETAYASIPELQ